MFQVSLRAKGIFLLAVLAFGCQSPFVDTPKANHGRLDARKFIQQTGRVFALVGEWEYYPGILAQPNDIPYLEENYTKRFFQVPGIWTLSFLQKGFLAGDGYGSFRLVVEHGLAGEMVSLRVPEMETAYNLYIDGKKVASNGIVATSELLSRPEYKPLLIDFIPKSHTSDFLLQISNFHHRKGGPGQVISFGRTTDVHGSYEKDILWDMLLSGSILFMGLYHISLYLNRRKDTHTYWFALTCLLISLRVFIAGNKYILEVFPNIPWEFHLKLSYLSFFLITPIFTRYVFLIFKPFFSRFFYDLISYIGYAFCFLVLVTKSSFYTYLMVPYQLFTFLAASYVFMVLRRALVHKQIGSLYFLLSFVLLLVAFTNDILVNNHIIVAPLVSHYGIFFMFFFQSVSIARGFSKGFRDAEILAIELSGKNQDLERMKSQLTGWNESLENRVKEKTLEVQSKLDQIRKDLKLAKSIIQTLTKIPDLQPHLQVEILYKPIQEVGGDIFFVKRMQDFYYRFFLSDATGHGLQAALYTMLIQSEFERISDVAMRPNDLLFYTNQHFYDKNADLTIYFPAIVLDFDFHQKILRYSGAGVQSQILMKKDGSIVLLPNSGPIVGIMEQFRYRVMETQVDVGDRVFLFTDGLYEELNEEDGDSAWALLQNLIQETHHLPLAEVIPFLKTKLFDLLNKTTWKDDTTLLVIEVMQTLA